MEAPSELLQQLLDIPSPTFKEQEIVAFLRQWMTDAYPGISILEHKDSLVATFPKTEGLPHIALVGHSDVVPTHFKSYIEGNQLHGPGASDMTGAIACYQSPRFLSVERVAELCQLIPSGIRRVAVSVNTELPLLQEYIDAGIDCVQLHGQETPEYAAQVQTEVWRAVRLRSAEQIVEEASFPCSKFVIDSFEANAVVPGGSGKKANWDLARKFIAAVKQPVLLAGGITSANAAEAMSKVNPAGLDLSSGVETEPGIKSREKIAAFFQALS